MLDNIVRRFKNRAQEFKKIVSAALNTYQQELNIKYYQLGRGGGHSGLIVCALDFWIKSSGFER